MYMVTEGFTANYQDLHIDKHLDLGRGIPFDVKNKTILTEGDFDYKAVDWVEGYFCGCNEKEGLKLTNL